MEPKSSAVKIPKTTPMAVLQSVFWVDVVLQSGLGSLPVRSALAYALSLGLIVVQIFALVTVLDRFGLMNQNPFEANTWHGRKFSHGEESESGPQYGFVLFVLGMFGCLIVTVVFLDWLLGL